jgi:hypothetical protein
VIDVFLFAEDDSAEDEVSAVEAVDWYGSAIV